MRDPTASKTGGKFSLAGAVRRSYVRAATRPACPRPTCGDWAGWVVLFT